MPSDAEEPSCEAARILAAVPFQVRCVTPQPCRDVATAALRHLAGTVDRDDRGRWLLALHPLWHVSASNRHAERRAGSLGNSH
jgi:hypothetical protein